MLSLLHHPNLVSMIGYCAEGDQRLLVYEYMPLGSLESHLHGNVMQHLASFYIEMLLITSYSIYLRLLNPLTNQNERKFI